MIKGGVKFVGVENLNYSFLPPRTYGLPFSQINLNVHHSMWERFEFRVIVGRAVENQVSRFEIFLLEALIRQQVELIGLIPLAKGVAKVLA